MFLSGRMSFKFLTVARLATVCYYVECMSYFIMTEFTEQEVYVVLCYFC